VHGATVSEKLRTGDDEFLDINAQISKLCIPIHGVMLQCMQKISFGVNVMPHWVGTVMIMLAS
jgi:hypothetical protein